MLQIIVFRQYPESPVSVPGSPTSPPSFPTPRIRLIAIAPGVLILIVISFLIRWIIDAMDSDIKQLRKISYTLGERLGGLLHYYPHKINNGLLEGLNNKIKTMKRQAYGYRDMKYFTLPALRSSCIRVRVSVMNLNYCPVWDRLGNQRR